MRGAKAERVGRSAQHLHATLSPGAARTSPPRETERPGELWMRLADALTAANFSAAAYRRWSDAGSAGAEIEAETARALLERSAGDLATLARSLITTPQR